MGKKWEEYFEKDVQKYNSLLEYSVNHWLYNDMLYFKIKNLIKPPAKILDVGCGYGFSAVYLKACGYEVTGVDNNEKILEEATKNAHYFNITVSFEHADAFDLSHYYKSFDLVYSCGVLEHFTKVDTIKLIKEQEKCGKYVIVVFPTKFTKYSGVITDEEIYNISQLCSLVTEAELNVIDNFGYGNVISPFHNWIHRIFPHGLYRLLQNRFSYCMSIGCIGRRKDAR